MTMTVSQVLLDKKFRLFSFNGAYTYSNGENFFLAFAPVRDDYVSAAIIKALRGFGLMRAYGKPVKPRGRPDVYLGSGYGLDNVTDSIQVLVANAKAGKTNHIWALYDPTTKEVREIKW